MDATAAEAMGQHLVATFKAASDVLRHVQSLPEPVQQSARLSQKATLLTAVGMAPRPIDPVVVSQCIDELRMGTLWPDEIVTDILNAMFETAPNPNPSPTGKERAPRPTMQNYENIFSYLTAWHWELVETLPESQRLQHFVTHAMALGMKHPTESSLQALIGAFLLCCPSCNGGPEKHYALLRHVKTSLRKSNRNTNTRITDEDPTELPAKPEQLKEDFPWIWARAFSANAPVPCPHTKADICLVLAQVPMRMAQRSAAAPLSLSKGPAMEDVFTMMAQAFGMAPPPNQGCKLIWGNGASGRAPFPSKRSALETRVADTMESSMDLTGGSSPPSEAESAPSIRVGPGGLLALKDRPAAPPAPDPERPAAPNDEKPEGKLQVAPEEAAQKLLEGIRTRASSKSKAKAKAKGKAKAHAKGKPAPKESPAKPDGKGVKRPACPLPKGKALAPQAPLPYKGGVIYTDVPGRRFKVRLSSDAKPRQAASWAAAGHPADVWDSVLAEFD